MTSSNMRLRSDRSGLIALLITAFILAFSGTIQAQVVSDPRVAEFDPSPDHWTVLDSGGQAVVRYELGVYPLGVPTPVGTVDMGKPSPEADGKIRFDFASHVAAWSLPGGEYEARVSAIGPEGAAPSDPSNPFTFTTSPACQYSLSATTVFASAPGGNYAADVVTGAGCEWIVSTAPPWVTMVASSGLGSGPVPFAVEANTASSSRTGTIDIGGQALTVRQDGAPVVCAYSLTPGSAAVDPAAGGNVSFSVAATEACSWTAATSSSWVAIGNATGVGSGTVSLTVTPNPTSAARTGTVIVEGRTFTVTQGGAGPACAYSVSPTVFSFSSAAGGGNVSPGTGSTCSWTAVSSDSWLVPSVTSGTGNNPVPFTVKQNNGMTNRTATLTVGPWAVTVFQSGKPRRTR